jgi:hypothetical protein
MRTSLEAVTSKNHENLNWGQLTCYQGLFSWNSRNRTSFDQDKWTSLAMRPKSPSALCDKWWVWTAQPTSSHRRGQFQLLCCCYLQPERSGITLPIGIIWKKGLNTLAYSSWQKNCWLLVKYADTCKKTPRAQKTDRIAVRRKKRVHKSM